MLVKNNPKLYDATRIVCNFFCINNSVCRDSFRVSKTLDSAHFL